MRAALTVTFIFACMISIIACNDVFGRTIEVKAVSEKGESISGAYVKVLFERAEGKDIREGRTDEEGIVALRGRDTIKAQVKVRKKGFYMSERPVLGQDGKKIKMVLREKKNPVPMYVKDKVLRFPEKGKNLGYDFKVADWVSPHGEGVEAHVYFKLEGVDKGLGKGEGRLVIETPNNKGGVRKIGYPDNHSAYRFPYRAPSSGYSDRLTHEYKHDSEKITDGYVVHETMNTEILGYLIKVVKEMEKGNEEYVANYGKILNEFEFSVGKNEEKGGKGVVKFTYYFNPNPNDRNIEFDPQRNLFDDAEKTFPP